MIGIIRKKNKKGNTKKAFSLVEVIVSVSIFSIMILTTTDIFSLVIDGQRAAIASQNVQESLKYFLEVVVKEMRMAQRSGVNECPGVLPNRIFSITQTSTGDTLNFKNYYGECVSYYTASSTDGTVRRFVISRDGEAGYISPEKINIDRLDFTLNNPALRQPFITINMQAHAVGLQKFSSQMTIQTSVVSRYYKD